MAPKIDHPALLNLAMELSLEFGPDWLKPIQSRLLQRCPDLTTEEADALDAFARSARDRAHALINDVINQGRPSEGEARELIRTEHPWLSESTFERLWSQGCYYAMK
jgi:hypothetical protein